MIARYVASIRSLISLFALASVTGIYAQPPLPAGTVSTIADLTTIHQFSSDLDDGGDFAMSSAGARFDMIYSLEGDRSIGWGMGYTADFYSFGGDTGLGDLDPWDTINTITLRGSYSSPLGDNWDFRIAPSISAAGEDSASVSDSLTYGALFVFTHKFNDKLMLGFGGGIFTGIEDTQAFPLLAVRWQFAPGWTLQNPLNPGPASPAGLEVAYAAETWEFAVGAAYRTNRFRLAEDGATPDGIGEYSGASLFFRASRPITEDISLNLYAGIVVGGAIELEKANGDHLIDSDFDTAPILSFSLSGRF